MRQRGERTSSKAWQRLYRLPEYKRGREEFLAANPFCVICALAGDTTPSNTVDHVTPHKGDHKLFLDRSNWQAVCKRCHDVQCQRKDKGLMYKGGDVRGYPIDPRHPWYEER